MSTADDLTADELEQLDQSLAIDGSVSRGNAPEARSGPLDSESQVTASGTAKNSDRDPLAGKLGQAGLVEVLHATRSPTVAGSGLARREYAVCGLARSVAPC